MDKLKQDVQASPEVDSAPEGKKPFSELVAERIIEQLKAGTAPWQKPWEAGSPASMLPMNPTTGRRYKGINALHLACQGRSDPRWMTFKQASAAGAKVRKGEKGTPVQFWKFSEERETQDESGRAVRESVQLERPRVFFATVFNAEQIEGLPALSQLPRPQHQWNPQERAEQILKASGAQISHIPGDRAFYKPTTDEVVLPERSQFASADRYYATALHELGHWTGHESRLNRDLNHPFGSEGYAREELRAEIASMILGDELGVGHDPGQHAAYVGCWIKALQADPLEIFRAAADAEKIHGHVMAIEATLQLSENQEQKLGPSQDPVEVPTFDVGQANLISTTASNSQEVEMHTSPQSDSLSQSERTYLEVPFREKDEAKSLGARWDRAEQSWYVPGGLDPTPFQKWNPKATELSPPSNTSNEDSNTLQGKQEASRLYLAVPYEERTVAKAAGAQWDRAAKSWYAEPDADLERLQRWLPEKVNSQQGPAMSPREEFGEALKALGCLVSGEHPIMDGQKHRIAVEGDKAGECAGFYVGHLDGMPAGYIKNNRTGLDMKWKSKGYVFSPEEKARLQAEAAAKASQRAEETAQLQEAASQRVVGQMADLVPLETKTPYIRDKEIGIYRGAFTDQEGQTTYLPVIDVQGKQWSMQYIKEDGTKRFAKDSRKEGCFHAVGGLEAVAAAPVLIVAEGYATAASIAQAAGQATVAAFDSGNLAPVVKALHERFPEKPVVVFGDDDRHLELTQGVNPGRAKALAAAHSVGGKAVFPVFAPGENTYPAGLTPVSPQCFREHERAKSQLDAIDRGEINVAVEKADALKKALLSAEQLSALSRVKSHTDFNDLASKSILGMEGLKRQIDSALLQPKQVQSNALAKPEMPIQPERVPIRSAQQRNSARL